MSSRASSRPAPGLALWLAAAALAGPAAAVEPPRPTVQEAVAAGRLAFIARVQALRETARHPTHTQARATLVVLQCLYGRACRDRGTLQLDYTPETVRDGALGVNLLLGREYLVLLSRPGSRALEFGSQWPRPMDMAYRLKTPLQPLAALSPADETITVENLWGGPPLIVDRAQLAAWAAQRAQALGR